MTNLGVLPSTNSSFTQGINSQGEVTGSADIHGSYHALVYSGGKIQGLGTLPSFTDRTGVGINDRGQIVGSGLHGGWERAFLLTPR